MNPPPRPEAARTREHATLTPNIMEFTVYPLENTPVREKIRLKSMLSLAGDNECEQERRRRTRQDRTGPLFNCLIYWASSKPLSVGKRRLLPTNKRGRHPN